MGENKTRQDEPVILINDSCLAFSVLEDAHKHIGTDKGLSTVIGTNNVLSYIKGHRQVGFQPQIADLVRALADVKLVGREGYFSLYHDLCNRVENCVHTMEGAGMKLIHGQHRMKGSTVIAVEDPSGAVAKRMKKKGYSTAAIYKVCPSDPSRCQTGWQLSMTPHMLRKVKDGKTCALDCFVDDLLLVHAAVKADPTIATVQKYFKENSLLAFLIAGNIDPFLFGLLNREGLGRQFTSLILRRFVTAQLDSGSICTSKRQAPVQQLVNRTGKQALLTVLAVTLFRQRRKSIRALVGKGAL